jgi:hypothetical protein
MVEESRLPKVDQKLDVMDDTSAMNSTFLETISLPRLEEMPKKSP